MLSKSSVSFRVDMGICEWKRLIISYYCLENMIDELIEMLGYLLQN